MGGLLREPDCLRVFASKQDHLLDACEGEAFAERTVGLPLENCGAIGVDEIPLRTQRETGDSGGHHFRSLALAHLHEFPFLGDDTRGFLPIFGARFQGSLGIDEIAVEPHLL